MPWPTYTERFCMAWDVQTDDFIVQAGQRAVIKSIAYTHTGVLGGGANVRIQNHLIWFADTQAPKRFEVVNLTVVAYELEVIAAGTGTVGQCVVVSGFLFADPVGRAWGGPDTKPIEPDRPSVNPLDLM